MPDPSVVPSGTSSSLFEQLQEIVEALADARRHADVFQIVLHPALEALKAVSGAVLVLDESGEQLEAAELRASVQKAMPGRPPFWTVGRLTENLPVGQALRRRQPLYFGWSGQEVWPEPRSAEVAGAGEVAHAVLPLFLDSRPFGAVVLDFGQETPFTPEHRRFLTSLTAQCTAALNRIELARGWDTRLREQNAALDAFVAFTEAVGSDTDVLSLARQAAQVLQANLNHVSFAYYELDDGLWKARVWSDDLDPVVAVQLQAGVPEDAPNFAEAVRAGSPLFVDGWDAGAEHLPDAAAYKTAAFIPIQLQGEVTRMVAAGTAVAHVWSPREQAIVRAVVRGLSLALERAAVAQRLQEQNEELQARTRALDGFTTLTRDLTLTADPRLLVKRAQEVVLSLLPDGYTLYYELDGAHWRNTVQTGDVGDAGLQAFIDSGPPVTKTPSIDRPWNTQEPFYQDEYAKGSDTDAAVVQHVNTAATLPVLVRGRSVGVLVACVFQARPWNPMEKTVLETVVRSLGLALERADSVAQLAVQNRTLDEERSALDAFVRFTEASTQTTDVLSLATQALDVLKATMGGINIAFSTLEDERWKAQILSQDVPAAMREAAQAGFAADLSTFTEPFMRGHEVFLDLWQTQREDAGLSGLYGAVAFYPYFRHTKPWGLLIVGLPAQRSWSERERSIFRSVGHSLELALDRAEQLQQLEEERAALTAFTSFTENTADTTEIEVLLARATEVLRTTLGDVSVAHYELDDGLWRAKAWSDDIEPDHLNRIRAGFPQDTPRFVRASGPRQPYFEDGWAPQRESLPAKLGYGAVASYPYFIDGRPLSLLSVGAKGKLLWSDRDRAIIRAVGRSLGLALERAVASRQLMVQRDALDAQAVSLAAANEELEAFTYSASHDLRTPVRHVMGFADLARKTLEKTPNEKALQYLDVIQQSAVRMTALIDGMLVLSRAGRDQFTPRMLDLSALVRQARQDVGMEFPTRAVRWHTGPLPQVWGDPDMLQQVLTNLTSNAVKYSGTRPVSEVRIEVEERPTEWVVSVSDNGVGFDPRYAQKLFGVFQRMHSQKEFEGTGVGLATVRRIVLKHGGRVFAESPDEVGATFGFTLPRPQ